MRTTKELLKLVDEHLHRLNGNGLCYVVIWLHAYEFITGDELGLLLRYIDAHKPTNFYALTHPISSYHWSPGAIEPRRRWLRKHINKL